MVIDRHRLDAIMKYASLGAKYVLNTDCDCLLDGNYRNVTDEQIKECLPFYKIGMELP